MAEAMALAMQGGSELRRPCCFSGYLTLTGPKDCPNARARSSKRNKGIESRSATAMDQVLDFLIAR